MTTQTPDAVREAVARELLANAMGSKHWASLVREGKDDDWGVIKAREAIAAILAALDSRAGDAGGKALFEHEMQQRGVDASWADLDEDEREGWRESARAVLSATPAPAVDDASASIEGAEADLTHEERVSYEERILALEMDIERMMKGEQPIYADAAKLEARAREVLQSDAYRRGPNIAAMHDENAVVNVGTAVSAMMTLAALSHGEGRN